MKTIGNFTKIFFVIVSLATCILLSTNINAETLRVAQNGKVTAYVLGASSFNSKIKFTVNFEDETTTPIVRPLFLSNLQEVGAKLDLGTHIAGKQLILVSHIVDINEGFYSWPHFNNDGKLHYITYQMYMEEGTPALLVRIEESYNETDTDYNDLVILLVNAVKD